MNRRGFVGAIAAMLAAPAMLFGSRRVVDDWPTRRCDLHDYEGVPPCPWMDSDWKPCPNGFDGWYYHAMRATGPGATPRPHRTGRSERVFIRDWKRIDRKTRVFFWREMIDKPGVMI